MSGATTGPARGPLAPLRDIGTGILAVSVKELRGRMRGRRAFAILTVNLMLVAGFALMIESIQEQSVAFGGSFNAAAQIGQNLFAALLLLQTLMVLVLAPAATSGSISLEREKQTLDLLITTPISSLAIVLGKLLSALIWVFLLLIASVPVTALVFTFGGVGPEDLFRGYLVLFVTAFGLGTLGLFFSALVKRTQASTVLNLVMALALTAGTTLVFVFWSATGQRDNFNAVNPAQSSTPPEALMYLNPFVAQADVICGTETGFGMFCSIVAGVTSQPVVGFGDVPVKGDGVNVAPDRDVVADVVPAQFGIPRDGFWPRSLAAWVVLSIVLIVISVQLVSPTRRWRIHLRPVAKTAVTWAGDVAAASRTTLPTEGGTRPRDMTQGGPSDADA